VRLCNKARARDVGNIMRDVQIVYVFENMESGHIKIGFTGQFPGWRLLSVKQEGCRKYRLSGEWRIVALMPGTLKDERRLHRALPEYRILGSREWYYPCEAVREFVLGVTYHGQQGATLKSWLGITSLPTWARASDDDYKRANAAWRQALATCKVHNSRSSLSDFARRHYANIGRLPATQQARAQMHAAKMQHMGSAVLYGSECEG
jgi:hypothetical protein